MTALKSCEMYSLRSVKPFMSGGRASASVVHVPYSVCWLWYEVMYVC